MNKEVYTEKIRIDIHKLGVLSRGESEVHFDNSGVRFLIITALRDGKTHLNGNELAKRYGRTVDQVRYAVHDINRRVANHLALTKENEKFILNNRSGSGYYLNPRYRILVRR